MEKTNFLKLNVPELKDKADILKISDNMTWIDEAVKALNVLHAEINRRLDSLDNKAAVVDTNITYLRDDLRGLSARVDETIQKLNTVSSKADSTHNSLVETKIDVSNLIRSLDGVMARVSVVETSTASNASRITALATQYVNDMAEITKRVAMCEATVRTSDERHKADMESVNNKFSNISASLKSITDMLANLDARVTALEEGPEPPTPPAPVEKFYVIWGASASTAPTTSVINNLQYKVFTDQITRTISVPCNDEYVYYAYPSGKGYVQFEVSGFTGGFENPAEVPVMDTEGNVTMYIVYRSTRKLTGTAPIKVK